MATTTGIVSDTGIAGLTLGGGIGWLASKYELTCDNILSFEIVTADGKLRKADAHENPDLYWALRSGGDNFGVVTAFECALHPVPQVLGGTVLHSLPRAREVLLFYRDFTRDCPDELTAYAAMTNSPDGHPVVAILACYTGNLQEGERVLEPVRRFGPPLADLIRPMPYSALITMLDAANPVGHRYYEKDSTLKELSDEAIDTLIASAASRTSPLSMCLIQHLHGAATRVPCDATAFVQRESSYVVGHVAQWVGGEDEAHIAWARGAWGGAPAICG